MTAVYRIAQDGWTADQAYAEMKKYRFEGFPGHPELKKFVYDTYTQLQTRSSGGGVSRQAVENSSTIWELEPSGRSRNRRCGEGSKEETSNFKLRTPN